MLKKRIKSWIKCIRSIRGSLARVVLEIWLRYVISNLLSTRVFLFSFISASTLTVMVHLRAGEDVFVFCILVSFHWLCDSFATHVSYSSAFNPEYTHVRSPHTRGIAIESQVLYLSGLSHYHCLINFYGYRLSILGDHKPYLTNKVT